MASLSTFASDAAMPDPTASPSYPSVYGPIPADRVTSGRVAVPGSKSLTQRYFNLALLLGRRLHIDGPLYSEDTRHYLKALAILGCSLDIGADHVVVTPGRGDAPDAQPRAIDCGAGGTMMRFMTAALTTVPGRSTR